MPQPTTWHAAVRYAGAHPITDDQADALAAHLPGYASAIVDHLGLQLEMTVDGGTLLQATQAALAGARTAYAAAFDVPGQPISMRILTTAAYEAEEAHPTPRQLLGLADIARIAGVTRQRAGALAARPDFPEPIGATGAGPVFTQASVEHWLATWDRKPGRPTI